MFQFPGYASSCPMYSGKGTTPLRMAGFPIRKSPDQRLLATPRSLSQLTTSFIASYRLGIHRVPVVAWSPTCNTVGVPPLSLSRYAVYKVELPLAVQRTRSPSTLDCLDILKTHAFASSSSIRLSEIEKGGQFSCRPRPRQEFGLAGGA